MTAVETIAVWVRYSDHPDPGRRAWNLDQTFTDAADYITASRLGAILTGAVIETCHEAAVTDRATADQEPPAT